MSLPPAFERHVLQLVPVMIREFGGSISFWTRGMQRLYHYDDVEAVGRRSQDLLKTIAEAPVARIEEEVRDCGTWDGELVQHRRDGERVVVASQWTLLRDDGGEQVAMMVCDSDITRQAAAWEEREHLASIVDGSQDAIIGKDLDGTITTWNKAAERIFGYSAQEIVGQSILTLFPPELTAEESAIIERLLRGERIEHYETKRLRKDGQQIEVALTVSPVRNVTGAVVGASKIVRDVTEQNRLRREIEQLQKELLHVARLNDMGQMASAFAHELNQPLAAVSAYLGGARRMIEAGDLSSAAEGCRRASGQVLRAEEVIGRLREFVRKRDVRRARTDLARLVRESEALALISRRFGAVQVQVDLAADATTAIVDEVQIQQVLVNLLRNAAEAIGDRPCKVIQVSAHRLDDQMIEVVVADSGPGLSQEVLSRLFQPFVTTKATGMGVGLSLCRTIVEDNGGTISGENPPAGGALFRIRLPSPVQVGSSA